MKNKSTGRTAQFPSNLSLISLLVIAASCMSSALAGEMNMDQSRESYRQAFEMHKERVTPVVG